MVSAIRADARQPAVEKPALSVVVSTWNRRDLVWQAVDSVIGQQYPGPLEIVVVDDGSTDGTMQELSARYPARALPPSRKLVLHSKPHTGLSGTVGEGITLCSGDYVAMCCSDDLWEPIRASELLAEVESTPNTLIHTNCKIRVTGGFRHPMYRDTDDAVGHLGWLPLEYPGNMSVEELLLHRYRKKRFYGAGLMVFPRKFLQGVFAMPSGLLNDDRWLAFAAMMQGSIRFANRNSYVWRIHGQNESLPETRAGREPAQRKLQFWEHAIPALRSSACRYPALLKRVAMRARVLRHQMGIGSEGSLAQTPRGISLSDLLVEPRLVLSYALIATAPSCYDLLRRMKDRLTRSHPVP